MYNSRRISVVIPCFKVAQHIKRTVEELPVWVDSIVLVNDCSPDNTAEILLKVAESDTRVVILTNSINLGVGGAMIAGFRFVLKENLAEVVVKMDGDGQMNPLYLPDLLDQLEVYQFAKGNRFNDLKALKSMPFIRRVGNIGLSFLIKGASGYWSVFDPTNGYFAVNTSTLSKLDLNRLANRYFFESSLLIELYYTGANVKDVSMPAIYGEEVSNLSVTRTLFGFPPKLFRAFIRRIVLSYFIYDFNITSVYILAGIPMFLFGLLFGLFKWITFASESVPAPTGTVMLAVLPFMIGFQMILSAIQHDVDSRNPFGKS